MELKDRLKKARTERGLSQAKLAELAGVTQPTIMFIENGRNKGSSKIIDIANALGVDPSWLAYGGEAEQEKHKVAGEVLNSFFSTEPKGEIVGMEPWDDETLLHPNEVEIPFFKDVRLSAGDGCFFDSNTTEKKLRFSKYTLKNKGIDPSRVVCVTADGESMEPVIPDGCTVAINLDDRDIKDGKVYAINNDGLLQIKMLRWLSGTKIIIESYNPSYGPDQKNLDEIEVLGRVFWYSVLL